MDPISAFSLASNAIHIVDFTSKLISQNRQIYNSATGALSGNVLVKTLRLDLVSLTENLEISIQEHSFSRIDGDEKDVSVDACALQDLCKSCQGIAKQLLEPLAKVKVRNGTPHQTWEDFKKALRECWDQKEFDILAAQLSEIRNELELRVLNQNETSHQLTTATQSIIDTFLDAREEFAGELQNQVGNLARLQGYHYYSTTGSRSALKTLRHQDDRDGDFTKELQLSAAGSLVEKEMILFMIENSILESLDFSSIRDRHEDVQPAYDQTFEWIYRTSPSKDNSWGDFAEWLRNDNGLYWINGKAGSGKSTLMKYIYNNAQTRRELQLWAGASSYDMCGFFFWNSGSKEQRSQRGLLRTLLFEMLHGNRDLFPKVFPGLWDTCHSDVKTAMRQGTGPLKASLHRRKSVSWTLASLKQAFRLLVEECQRKGVKLCFFIDGLDEYNGDHKEMADYFLEFSHKPGVKMCLSSRPLVVFEAAFEHWPSLKLQDLTRGDISHYVEDKLGNNRHMARLSEKSPDQPSSLVRQIVDKANGVFLWVKLVVKSLLQGLRDRNRISDLQKRLQLLPADLEPLYEHMLARTDPFYAEQASQIFQIVLAAQRDSASRQITLLQLSWAEDEDRLLTLNASIRPLSSSEIEERCKLMDSKLKGVCSGLLESYDSRFSTIAPDARVVCLHRTVSDFFKKPSVWESIIKHTAGTRFCPHMSLLRSSLLRLKALNINIEKSLDMSLIRDALHYAGVAEKFLGAGFPSLLDQLDATATYQWRLLDGRERHGRLEKVTDDSTIRRPASKNEIGSQDRNTRPITPDSENVSDQHFDCRSSGEFDMSRRGSPEKQVISQSPLSKSQLTTALQEAVEQSQRISIRGRPGGKHRSKFENFDEEVVYFKHWTYGIEISGAKAYHQDISFYDLAKVVGLEYYVASKDQTRVIVDYDVNYHLLLHTVTCYSRPTQVGGEAQVPDPNVVKRALEAGTDPNFAFHGHSPWEEALTGLLSLVSKYDSDEHLSNLKDPRTVRWTSEVRTWLLVIKLFLVHGADASAMSKHHYGRPRIDLQAIIWEMPNTLESECVETEAIIKQTSRPVRQREWQPMQPEGTSDQESSNEKSAL
ncbi:hypothetical protein BJ875DRAFT_523413 [Amylocarpus encephaloides]|uniref:NACHT domain-containing protein n=1 Tax=Amylocarpus encephaloides TaxID=45428 RepID=A0A9P8C0N8_9HELO|nr:hypothetical protein BJ875DRAFT_523413 [Amylocarpus encephaloides]